MRVNLAVLFLVLFLSTTASTFPQSPNGSISGVVLDPDTKSMPGAEVIVLNDLTGVRYVASTNNEGIYAVPNLPPGSYRIQVSKVGFKSIIKPEIVLNVQDALSINFTLPIGASSVVVTVEGGAAMINTTDATVSTVVDRQFAENLPLNGRSFQSLIELTPGVVLSPSTQRDAGQFNVNGQRASSNYWMVDGVSANIGVSTGLDPGNGFGGTLGSFSVLGGTNSLVSVDALQEFRIQTSTYAPEFGRTPGAQISIVTRSGTNHWHGTAFDYLRNDALDANNWFNGYTNVPPLPKPEERQNDFGGTLNGPILKKRTFFFFSYEGLRLRLPQTVLTSVPSLAARQSAASAMQPYLNAYPRPNGVDSGNGIAPFNSSFSNRATLDAYSLRIDHKLGEKVSLFGRYNYSPSELAARGQYGIPLSQVSDSHITTQTATVGGTWAVSPRFANDLRFNYSRTSADNSLSLDTFGGAVPLTQLPFPSSVNPQNALFVLDIFSLSGGLLTVGKSIENVQRQINLTDNVSMQRGTHDLKFGVDFRRLSPATNPRSYDQDAFFGDVSSAEAGNLLFSYVYSRRPTTLLFHNLGVFAQDTWRVAPRLTLTYGLRWDLDFAPSTADGPSLPAATSFNVNNLGSLAIAPPGTPVFDTKYGNVAPRAGIAYQLRQDQNSQTVLRGGFGVFYDLASSEVGNLLNGGYPFVAYNVVSGGTFPLSSATAAPPAITPAALATGAFWALDPNLKLPYTLEWNVALEQALGRQQTISATYLGSLGRRLLQTEYVIQPNANFGYANVVSNTARSNYNALQVQFQRRLSQGVQALASYTLSHSIDNASAGSIGSYGNTYTPSSGRDPNRANSAFDIRNSFSAGVTYDIPGPKRNVVASAVFGGWSLQNFVQARSASPLDLYYSQFVVVANGAIGNVRPDVVAGQPFYLYGAQYPGGKSLNAAAFQAPPIDASKGLPLREGNLARNALRGFGATQWDLGLHRDFPIKEFFKLQFRAEIFNVLNHPNFGPPVTDLSNSGQFGKSTQLLGQSLGGSNLGGGGFDPLYQIGGPRSIQLALKVVF